MQASSRKVTQQVEVLLLLKQPFDLSDLHILVGIEITRQYPLPINEYFL
jgi:hypothetical protein